MRSFLAISLLATMLALTGTAAAQQPLDHERCSGKGGVTPEQQIDACATLVGSGQLSPEHLAGALNNRGSGYQRKQQYDRAIQDYDQAIKLSADNAVAFRNRGDAYRLKGLFDRAIQDYDQAIKLNPNAAAAFQGRGLAYRAKAVWDFDAFLNDNAYDDRAIQDYDQVVRLSPKFAVAYKLRADAYRAKRRYDLAIKDYNQAIGLDPNVASFYVGRALVFRQIRQPDRAIAGRFSSAELRDQVRHCSDRGQRDRR